MTGYRVRTLLIGGLVATIPLLGLTLGEGAAYAEAEGCAPGMVSDFNGDGFSDAVVADPYATVDGRAQAGRVIVLYGDADGRVGEGARGTVSQSSAAVGGTAETGDRFGSALAAADLDCDGFTDLIVGTPNEDVGSRVDSGLVQFIWGGPRGLGVGTPSREITQDDFYRPPSNAAGDQFGYAVDALEDVGQGGTPAPGAYAVAIGVPGGNVGGKNDAGWVAVRHAFDGGTSANLISQATPGVPGTAEPGDRFGTAVTINYLVVTTSSDGIDVAIGAPGEDIGSLADAGTVTVVPDVYSDDGVFPYTMQLHQDSAGVPDTAEAGDKFGTTLDSVHPTGASQFSSGTSQLAVGVPGEDVGSARNAGAVQLFDSDTIDLIPGASLTQNTPGVSGVAESGDLFGSQLAFAAPSLGDSATRLAVSVPSEDGAKLNQGIVQVFPVTDLGAEATYAQDSPGVPGAAEAGDEFGETLAFVSGAAERALIVGVPDDVGNRAGMVNVIPLGGGAARAWVPGSGGIPSAGASRFGGVLASVHGGTT